MVCVLLFGEQVTTPTREHSPNKYIPVVKISLHFLSQVCAVP